jgi:flagellar L-ring protein precursor FlgH
MRTLTLPAAALLLWLSGCAPLPQPPRVDFAEPKPQPVATATPAPVTGSLYSKSTYRPAFEDRRARLVGDTVTILIVENLAASQKSTSTANRTTSISGGITAFPGFDFPGTAAENRTNIGANSANDFSGKGGTESSNTFSGSITTTVAEVLPNGHLLVVGHAPSEVFARHAHHNAMFLASDLLPGLPDGFEPVVVEQRPRLTIRDGVPVEIDDSTLLARRTA